MTRSVEVAMGEIVRVAWWSLRALGMKFGVADRAAPIVAWTEAVEGRALETLRTQTSQLSPEPPTNWSRAVSPGFWRLDGTGRSLLEIGPVAIDLLTLAARTRQVGRVDFTNVVDLRFLSGLARIGARRQLGIVALSSGEKMTLCGKTVGSFHVFPGRHQAAFEENGLPRGRTVEAAFAEWHGMPDKPDAPTFSLFSYRPDEHETRESWPASLDEAEGRFAFAHAHGVQVHPEDLAYLYQVEIKTWAPTSERSRKQALF